MVGGQHGTALTQLQRQSLESLQVPLLSEVKKMPQISFKE